MSAWAHGRIRLRCLGKIAINVVRIRRNNSEDAQVSPQDAKIDVGLRSR